MTVCMWVMGEGRAAEVCGQRGLSGGSELSEELKARDAQGPGSLAVFVILRWLVRNLSSYNSTGSSPADSAPPLWVSCGSFLAIFYPRGNTDVMTH